MAYKTFRKGATVGALAGASLVVESAVDNNVGIQQGLANLEHMVSSATNVPEQYLLLGEFGAAVLLTGAILSAARNSTRRHQFAVQQSAGEPQKTDKKESLAARVAKYTLAETAEPVAKAVGATVVAALAMRSVPYLQEAYNAAANGFALAANNAAESAGSTARYIHSLLMDQSAHPLTSQIAKYFAGIAAVDLFSKEYSSLVERRHGPVQARITVDQYTPFTRWLRADNMKMALRNLWKFTSVSALPEESRKLAGVGIYDWRKHKTIEEGAIWYDREQAKGTVTCLKITADDIKEAADKAVAAYDKIFADAASPEPKKVPGKDLRGMPKVLDDIEREFCCGDPARMSAEEFNVVKEYLLHHNDLRHIDEGKAARYVEDSAIRRHAPFVIGYVRSDKGAPIQIAYLGVDLEGTLSQSRQEYGPNFVRRGKLALTFKYGAKLVADEGATDDSVHGGAQDTGHDTTGLDAHDAVDHHAQQGLEAGEHHHDDDKMHIGARSQQYALQEFRPGWNQVLFEFGFGKIKRFEFQGDVYNIDDLWLRSGGFIDIGRSGRAVRRYSYVVDGNKNVVASVRENWSCVPTKWHPLDNIDLTIDVYDPKLADSISFMRVLSLVGLTNSYRPRIHNDTLADLRTAKY